MDSLSQLCAVIQERYRQREDLHRAEQRLTLQIKAICRRFVRGDLGEAAKLYASIEGKGSHPLGISARSVTAALWKARSDIQQVRFSVQAELESDSTRLPIWPRVQATPGLGALNIACLIGETGNLSNYATHSKLWKRLGLAVIDGRCQRRVGGADAVRQGYSPRRRSVVWSVGSNMLRSQSAHNPSVSRLLYKPAGPFRLGYDARKAYELANGLPKAHAHNRAKRYMEKKLVRNIWRAWRELTPQTNARTPVSCDLARSSSYD